MVTWFVGLPTYLQFHRGISHSIFVVPFWAFIGAILLYYASRKKAPFWGAFVWFSILVFVHLSMDWVTSYGTSLLSPFSNKTYSAHLFPILDVWVIAIMALCVTLSRITHFSKRTFAIWATVFLFAFAGFRAGAKTSAERMIIENFGMPKIIYSFNDIESSKSWVNPLRYRVVARNGDTAISYKVQPLRDEIYNQGSFILLKNSDRLWQQMSEKKIMKSFLMRADLPIAEVNNDSVYLTDLRYSAGFGVVGSITIAAPYKNGEIVGEPDWLKAE
jgi:membrane-bound metal-dependent hydrolase YbcI (DUF457 family)